ncbi:MAG: hypothetical protein H0T15_00340 [Thermoleophilaceae bacterium]|nr:hypothetical protein [Thermoleophilaceae bacterium]
MRGGRPGRFAALRHRPGFNGGDGGVAIPLRDGRTLFFFGDSYTAPTHP